MDPGDSSTCPHRCLLLHFRRHETVRAIALQPDATNPDAIPYSVSARQPLFVSLVEFACGAGLILGLLTPLCAVMLMGDMIVAILTNRIGSIHASGFLAFLDDFLYLPEVLYALILFWLLFSGPGPYSVDGMMARRWASLQSTDR